MNWSAAFFAKRRTKSKEDYSPKRDEGDVSGMFSAGRM